MEMHFRKLMDHTSSSLGYETVFQGNEMKQQVIFLIYIKLGDISSSIASSDLQVPRGEGGSSEERWKEHSVVMNTFIILWYFPGFKVYQMVYFKYVQIILCQFFFNEAIFKMAQVSHGREICYLVGLKKSGN